MYIKFKGLCILKCTQIEVYLRNNIFIKNLNCLNNIFIKNLNCLQII